MTMTSFPVSTVAPAGPRQRRSFTIPNWLKNIPFVGLHIACLSVLFLPNFGVSVGALALCALTYFLKMFGITAGYHRYFAHRAYRTSRPVQFVLAWLGCTAMQRGPLWWAAHHRVHHRYSDTPKDPHSPHETSFWWAHLGWVTAEDAVDAPWETIQDFRSYAELRWLDSLHWIPGIALAVACYLVGAVAGGWDGSWQSILFQWTGWSYLVWGWLISTVLTYHATFSINSLSHLWGNRRYATNDDSRNNGFLAVLTMGEGWHNNHHHYQSSANQGFRWWEFDMSYLVIRSAQFVGLVWDVRTPNAKALAHGLVHPSSPCRQKDASHGLELRVARQENT
jgi:stearoyl-CoA desaturase (Delta-9 desaturase)